MSATTGPGRSGTAGRGGSGGDPLDLLVIGGGVMGLFAAHHAVTQGDRVVVLERGRVGDPMTASFGRTRSYRRDYLDPVYARLADEAMRLWSEFERRTGSRALVRCGCMNIASAQVTPDLAGSYAARTTRVLADLGWPVRAYPPAELADRFPYLRADLGHDDVEAGLVDLPAVTAALTGSVEVREGVTVTRIEPDGELVRVRSDTDEFLTRSLVITAGHGTNDVLALLPGPRLEVPISRDRPSEARYYHPEDPAPFTAGAMPVIAYLDTGIYLHPIVPGLVDAVKIGYYNPPDVPRGTTSVDGIDAFVRRCMPGLLDVGWEPVTDTDGCDYDLVADDDFVLGPVPGVPNTYVGVGWRGTGYKFAPWVGRVLFELARRHGTVYDIRRFDPARFVQIPELETDLEGEPT